MFFEARERFAQQRPNEYVRGLLSQYGNHGKPVQLPKAPSHTDALQAAQFRQRELEQLKYATERAKALEAQLRQSRKDARILAQYAQQFLGKSANDRRRDRPPDGHTRSAPVLHTASRPTDADNAHGPQEINSDPIVMKGDEPATVSRSGRRASVDCGRTQKGRTVLRRKCATRERACSRRRRARTRGSSRSYWTGR